MRIHIAQRYKPFSHIPGEPFILPGTTLGFQIYPTLIKAYDFSFAKPVLFSEIPLTIKGPALDFTIQQDLERGVIKVWGHYKEGFLRYLISPMKNNEDPSLKGGDCLNQNLEGAGNPLQNTELKDPSLKAGVSPNLMNKEFSIIIEKVPPQFALVSNFLANKSDYQTKKMSRLSLGSHRMQDWELIKRRGDLVDILPLWSQLGQWIPQTSFEGWEGTLILLKKCKEAIESKEKLILYDLFLDLFKGAFQGGLYPCLEDPYYQGYGLLPVGKEFRGSPLFLLSEGAKTIQDIFISIQSKEIALLEVLPPQFHCGRFIDIDCGDLGTLSMEWSKKTIRRLIFFSRGDNKLLFRFQHGLKRFRLRTNSSDLGKFIEIGIPLTLEANVSYFFDNFQA